MSICENIAACQHKELVLTNTLSNGFNVFGSNFGLGHFHLLQSRWSLDGNNKHSLLKGSYLPLDVNVLMFPLSSDVLIGKASLTLSLIPKKVTSPNKGEVI